MTDVVIGMKKLVGSLLKSIPELINVVAFLAFLFFIFGILGIQMWSGILHARCRLTPFPVQIQNDVPYPIASSYIDLVSASPNEYQCRDPTGDIVDTDATMLTYGTSQWKTPQFCFWPVAPDTKHRVCDMGRYKSGFICPNGQVRLQPKLQVGYVTDVAVDLWLEF